MSNFSSHSVLCGQFSCRKVVEQRKNQFTILRDHDAVTATAAAALRAFETILSFGVRQPHAQPPTWRARVFLFVWFIAFDLSGMGSLPLA